MESDFFKDSDEPSSADNEQNAAIRRALSSKAFLEAAQSKPSGEVMRREADGTIVTYSADGTIRDIDLASSSLGDEDDGGDEPMAPVL